MFQRQNDTRRRRKECSKKKLIRPSSLGCFIYVLVKAHCVIMYKIFTSTNTKNTSTTTSSNSCQRLFFSLLRFLRKRQKRMWVRSSEKPFVKATEENGFVEIFNYKHLLLWEFIPLCFNWCRLETMRTCWERKLWRVCS